MLEARGNRAPVYCPWALGGRQTRWLDAAVAMNIPVASSSYFKASRLAPRARSTRQLRLGSSRTRNLPDTAQDAATC